MMKKVSMQKSEQNCSPERLPNPQSFILEGAWRSP